MNSPKYRDVKADELLADFKGQDYVSWSDRRLLTGMQTGNVERVMISGVHIDDMDLLVAKIDDNNGIDITLSGTANNFDFIEQIPDYMASNGLNTWI